MTASKQVHLTELVLRDAHQSLLATRMRTDDMLPVCEQLDRAGFWSIEAWGGATFDACLRFLGEDPWQRLRRLKRALPNTRIQMLLRGQNLLGYRHYSDDVVQAFVHKAAENGVDVFRVFDAMNDLRNLETSIRAVVKSGKHAQGAICYTVSPVHTIAHFVKQAIQLQEMGCHSIAIKDMAGLLTPTRTVELFSALSHAVSVPLALHSHTTVGTANICLYLAAEHGCQHIDTAISALSWGASHSPTESMVVAFDDTVHRTGLKLELLQEINAYFRELRKKYHEFESEYAEIDTRVMVNQVPGGMISNLSNQLKEQGALARMDEVLAEIPRVREDFGFPPLVTPTSQIVGAQAALNVLCGERYKRMSNEAKAYLQGRYGRAPGAVNDKLRQRAIGDDEIIDCRPADLLRPEMRRLRTDIGALATSEEDVLTYAMFPELGRRFLEQRANGTLAPERAAATADATTAASPAPIEFDMTLHGESYHVRVNGTGHHTSAQRPYYVTVDGVPEEVLIEVRAHADGSGVVARADGAGSRPRATRSGHVTSSMPGTVVDVLVKAGAAIEAGRPVLIVEAMKMESEVLAPVGGTVTAINVSKGDKVSPHEALVEIE